MNNLQFIKKLYNGKNCYSDSLTKEELELLRITSGVDQIVKKMIYDNKIIFLTGNPGDGKTYIIRTLEEELLLKNIYIQTDMNEVTEEQLESVVKHISDCFHNFKGCIIAANEFPFFKLIRVVKRIDTALYDELISVKRHVIMYGYPSIDLHRICIIDLNERNLLDKDRSIIKPIIEKFINLLKERIGLNAALDYNINALKNELVIEQLLKLFNLVSMSGEHFAIRDILGTISYMLISSAFDDETHYYYDAIFTGDNDLMAALSYFDPILLSIPSLDEQLWNGEKKDGWLLSVPERWPWELTTESVEDATALFKSLKRKFYFENIYAKELSALQPADYTECVKIFTGIKSKNEMRRTCSMLVNSMNRLFLSTDEEKERLRIWTTHSYDLSREAGAAVSTKYIDTSDLVLDYPEPITWLKELEYAPRYLIMKLKDSEEPKLEIDIDLLRSLIGIKNGYPVSLLSGRYEQAVSQFAQELALTSVARDYGNGEILIANRRDGSLNKIVIEENKYRFSEGGEY